MNWALLTMALFGLMCIGPLAYASTLPSVDFEPNQTRVSVGVFNASVDVSATERLACGASFLSLAMHGGRLEDVLTPDSVSGRITYRLLQGTEGFSAGLTLSAGQHWPMVNFDPQDDYQGSAENGLGGWHTRSSIFLWWLQPALNVTIPLFWEPLKLRATLGPVFHFGDDTMYLRSLPIIIGGVEFRPNVELSYRIVEDHEITFGGNGLIGWRGVFRLSPPNLKSSETVVE